MNSLPTSLRKDFTDNINTVGMKWHIIVSFGFVLIPSFSTVIFLVYTDRIFPSVKFTAIYQQKYFVSIFICICQFFRNDTFQNKTQNQSKIQVQSLSKIKLKSNLDLFFFFHVVSKWEWRREGLHCVGKVGS